MAPTGVVVPPQPAATVAAPTSTACEQPVDSMQSQAGKMKLRLHCRGTFVKGPDGECRYEGGEVFNDSIPFWFKYADLCHKLNDKFGETVSIRYLAPGDIVDPNNLVAVADDDDLMEMFEEYQQALQRPGTPLKTFRIHLYVEKALQFETACEEDGVDDEQEAMEASLCDHDTFDPNDWCSGDDHSMISANPSTDTEAQFTMAQQQHKYAPHAAPLFRGGFVHQQLCTGAQLPAHQQVPDPAACLPHDLDDCMAGCFAESPAAALAEDVSAAHIFTNGRGSVTAVAGHAKGYGSGGSARALEHHALTNINKSVSRCDLGGHMGYGDEEYLHQYEELDDPYHDETDDLSAVLANTGYRLQQGTGQVSGNSTWGYNPGVASGALQELHAQQKPTRAAGAAHSKDLLVGTGLPSHISEFGEGGSDDKEFERPVQLPSHISAFGDGSLVLGEQPSMATQDREQARSDVAPGALAARRALGFAALDQNNGGWAGGGLDDSAVQVAKNRSSKVITQEFAHDDDSLVRPLDGPLDFNNLDGDATVELAPTPKTMQGPLIVKVAKDDVCTVRKIGEGAFGEVSQAQVFPYGSVAIKWLKRDRFAKYSESFQREAEVLAKLNHPNIIRMFGLVMEGDPSSSSEPVIAGIMTEYVRNGSLSQKLRTMRSVWSLRERCHVALQAALGMAYLHEQDPAVIHFDLKPDNLLVDGEGDNMVIKVADFGLSKHKFQSYVTCRDLRGTLPYMAPELVSNPNQVCEKCDVWSMGVVMWEMCTLEVPFQELSAQQILMGLMHGNLHLHVPEDCEGEWRTLIEVCMTANPASRPTFKQLAKQLELIRQQAS